MFGHGHQAPGARLGVDYGKAQKTPPSGAKGERAVQEGQAQSAHNAAAEALGMAAGIRVRRYKANRRYWEVVVPGGRSRLATTKKMALRKARDLRRSKRRQIRIR